MSLLKRTVWLNEQVVKSKTHGDKSIVLFDMDGTLTPPRKALSASLIKPLRDLSEEAMIGIVSGSDYDYIKEQLSYLIEKTEVKFNLHILPCNGTKYYTPPTGPGERHKLVHDNSMKECLGKKSFNDLMKELLELQNHISRLHIPLTGSFINYRGSMLNWCPIGRNANPVEREAFIKKDNEESHIGLRKQYLKRLKRKLELLSLDKKVVCTLGGDTSFDIYPIGWDKTYALRHFEDKDVWFVGDRCEEGGNDKALYDSLVSKNRSFKTKSPDNTKEIIEEIIKILHS